MYQNTSTNLAPHLYGPLSLAPLVNGRNISSVVNDGSEPRLVSYFINMKVLSIASGKHHMLAITDNGVSYYRILHNSSLRVRYLIFLQISM